MSVSAAPTATVPATSAESPVLRVESLSTSFIRRGKPLQAVRDVSFELRAGETLVLLGESGSGKSVTARSILRLHGKQATVTGSVMLGDVDLLTLGDAPMRNLRGSRMALVPQDPNASLDPLRRVGHQIAEVLQLHGISSSRSVARARALELLSLVGIPDPPRVFASYPHELSGGMRQRVAIAIAISCEPTVLIADEPTTALDVTVQAQILRLFQDLQHRLSTALLLVTHDVTVAAEIADRVGVMYAGQIVEYGPATEVLQRPRHPYTQALLGALPLPGMARGSLRAISGAPPVAGTAFSGCSFADRCGAAVESCHQQAPVLITVQRDHRAACPVLNSPSNPADSSKEGSR